jgi:superoxide dismutase, Fe-Mn family
VLRLQRMRTKRLPLFFAVALATRLFMNIALGQVTHWEMRGLASGTSPFKAVGNLHGSSAFEPYLSADLVEHHHRKHRDLVFAVNKSLAVDIYGYWNLSGRLREPSGEFVVMDLFRMRRGQHRKTQVSEERFLKIEQGVCAHYNHTLYWQTLTTNVNQSPTGALAQAIQERFGSFELFHREFTNRAAAYDGEGWVWLSLSNGRMEIEVLPGEDSPLRTGRPVLLGLDLWRHAYGPQYGRRKMDYVQAWFSLIDWNVVSERFRKHTSGHTNIVGPSSKPGA